MQIVHFGEKQKPDVLDGSTGQLQDVSQYTEEVVQVTPGEKTKVAVVWDYAYYDIPITSVPWDPSCQRRSRELPFPEISEWDKVVDPETGKWIGLSFTVTVGVADAWPCNVQVACEYYNEEMGRTYIHRRTGTFTIASQRPIGSVLEEVRDSFEE